MQCPARRLVELRGDEGTPLAPCVSVTQTRLEVAAEEHLDEVADKTQHDDAAYLGTLSLAYHLTGDTSEAIANQKIAIGLLPEGEFGVRDGLEEALATFEAVTNNGDVPD